MSLISDGSYRVLYFVHGQAAVILFLLSAERHRPREEIGPRTVTLEEAPAVLALVLEPIHDGKDPCFADVLVAAAIHVT